MGRNVLIFKCHKHVSVPVSFLRQYPRQLPVWRHTLFIFSSNYFHTSTLNPLSSHAVFPDHFSMFSRRTCSLNEQNKQAWVNLLTSQAGRGRGERQQTPCANLNFVSHFLLTNTELVKVSAARAWASLHWHCFKRALPVSKNGGDKSPREMLVLCTLSLSLSRGLGAVTALRTFTLCSRGDASLGQLSRSGSCSSVRDPRWCGSLCRGWSVSQTPRE